MLMDTIRLGSAKRLYPEDIYLSPCFAIKRMIGLRQKYGNFKALTSRRFQREREMWIAGVFLLALGRITRKEYWLRPIVETNTPDIVALSLSQTPDGTLAEFQNIEIFEYEQHFSGNLVEAIKSKIANKSYPDNYTLLCYVHGRVGEILKPYQVYQQMLQLSPKLSQIWVMCVFQLEKSRTHTVIQVFPEPISHNFDYVSIFKQTKQKELIRARRDLTRKTNAVEFEDLGQFILPLP